MSQEEDDKRKSVSLSEVLGEIGVNEHTIRIRRKCTLLKESITTFSLAFTKKNIQFYCFGSQSEGATTPGLKSDADVLTVLRNYHVIQDLSEWKPGISDLMLMIQDETTSTGYCLLQLLRKDTPQPAGDPPSSDYKTDDKGRILFRNSAFRPCEIGCEYNGPANTFPELPGRCSIDGVPAFYCDSWPVEARGWLERKCVGDWPSESMKRLAVSKGCFLVPVDSKCNPMTADVEWRISTSMAERIMMFDLNMTQIHTYVVLKCICKTFFTMDDKSLISSFMCKCTLLYYVENTPRSFWQVGMLYPCVITCLCELRKRVLDLNCPHYIIPTNNLMANRINGVEQQHLLLVIDKLIQQNVDMFMFIEIDDFGERLFVKMNKMSMHLATRESSIVGSALLNLSAQESNVMCQSLREIEGLDNVVTSLLDGVEKLQEPHHTLDDIQTEAMAHIYPHVCTWIGSTLAASSVKANNTVSPEAIRWFSAGQNIDVASSRLKLAAAFYCAGDITNAELTLQDIERRYTLLVAPL